MRFTTFADMWAKTKQDHDLPWEAICHSIANAPEFDSKAACPWISLAVYGPTPNENGCLRYAKNIQAITGLEGDYDAGDVSIDEAASRARAGNLRACFYTSSRHRQLSDDGKQLGHRWRVLVPLSHEMPLTARASLLDRLNGVLGGILTGESWNDSQAFLIGRVRGVEYRCLVT